MIKTQLGPIFYLFFILTCVISKSFGQNKQVNVLTGIIKNTNNEFVDGATLFLKNGSDGQVIKQTLSDKDGGFSFTIKAGSYVISISYLGTLSYQSDLIKLRRHIELFVYRHCETSLHPL